MSKTDLRTVECPTCKKQAAWSPKNKWRPFCCERCKLIDLGDWFEERNRIPDETEPVFPNEGENDKQL
jgi:endogenous inhibitor of DNA gyrase (YacG/DUF329 family)